MGEALAPDAYASVKVKSASIDRRMPLDVAIEEFKREGEWIKFNTGNHTIMLRKGRQVDEFTEATDKALGGESYDTLLTVFPRTDL